MFALTVALSVASTTSSFYEGVSPVSGQPPTLGGELTRWRGPKLNRSPLPRTPAPSDPVEGKPKLRLNRRKPRGFLTLRIVCELRPSQRSASREKAGLA